MQAAGDVQQLDRVSESFHRGVLNQLLRIVGSDLKKLGFSKAEASALLSEQADTTEIASHARYLRDLAEMLGILLPRE